MYCIFDFHFPINNMQNQPNFFSKFQDYPSIDSFTSSKFTKAVTKSKSKDQNVLWIATQKIHGSNFSIVYDFQTNHVKYARRNDFITNQIPVPCEDVTPFFLQNFMDSPVLVNTFHNSLDKIKQNISKRYPGTLGVQIFGQYYGGYWPGEAGCKKRVQLGVYYTPDHEFMVFDILLLGMNPETTIWIKATQISSVVQNHLKHVPIYAKGTYEQIISIPTEFNSTIPQILGLDELKNNICQGLILRPNMYMPQKGKILLKKKNQQFLQKAGHVKKTPAQLKLEAQQANEHMEYLKPFVNANRIESAISKYPDFQDQIQLKTIVIEDVFADVEKESEAKAEELKKLKKVTKTFDKFVYKQVLEYLQTVRTQFTARIKRSE